MKIPPLRMEALREVTQGPSEHCVTEAVLTHQQVPLKQQATSTFEENLFALFFTRLFRLASLGVCVASVVLSATLLRNQIDRVQYCTVSSFFFGVFGSICSTHLLYALWQASLFKTLHTSGQQPNWLLWLLADHSVLTQLQEQLAIREHLLQKKPSLDLESSEGPIQHRSLSEGDSGNSRNVDSEANPKMSYSSMKRGVKNDPVPKKGKPLEDSMGTTFDKSLLQSKQVAAESAYGLDEQPRKATKQRPMTTETAVGRGSVLKTSFGGHETEEFKEHPVIKEDNATTPSAYMTIT